MPKDVFRKLEKARVAGQQLQISRVRSVPPKPARRPSRKPSSHR
jgi:hypothetical protein